MWLRWIVACDGEPTRTGGGDVLPTDPPADTAPVPDPECADLPWTGSTVTGSTVDQGDDRAASCGGAGGAEVVYLFTAPTDGVYVFDTVGSSVDLLLAAFETCDGPELGCDDDGAGGLDAMLRLPLSAGQTALVQVEAYEDGGDYVVNVSPADPTEVDCANGLDDDLDRWPDCLDDDCAAAPTCAPLCPDGELSAAPAVFEGSTLGRTDEHGGYCTDFGPNSDYTVAFTAPAHARYLFEATGVGFGAVLSVRFGSCDAYESWCVRPGDASWFDLTAGETLYVDVTGQFGAAGPFTLAVDPYPLVEADCTDGEDEDLDYWWDCGDPDCDLDPACFEDCANGSDDDGDGRVDCADGGCAADPTCAVPCPEGALTGPLPVAVSSSTYGSTPNESGTCAPTAAASDQTWSFVAPADATYTFEVDADFDSVLLLLAGCGGAELACDDDSGPDNGSALSVALAQGEEVLVVVDGYDTESGGYTLTVTN
ncbi:MAG: hypothetical protein ABMA64_08865 [Myxococcota bacterium]